MNTQNTILIAAAVCGVGIGIVFLGPATGPPTVRPPAPVVEMKTKPHSITNTSRNSTDLPVDPRRRELVQLILADGIAFRGAWHVDDNEHDRAGSWFTTRLLLENYRLNLMMIDKERLDELIAESGCDPKWSARAMQTHINGYLVLKSDDSIEEQEAQGRMGRYGFGWLGEPGDQSLDAWRFAMGLAPGETLADHVVGVAPAGYAIGGIPLRPRRQE